MALITWRLSAALRNDVRLSCETCTSPLYMNSSKAFIFCELVPSKMTSKLGHGGAESKRSWKCLLHAANISLWALKVTPAIKQNKTKQFNQSRF